MDQFTIAYNEYLNILAGIDSRVRALLKQDSKNWWMLNMCVSCLYKLENEPKLKHSLLVSMDGNQSLKLVDSKLRGGTPHLDTCRIVSDFLIPEEIVDLYKDKVKNAKRVCIIPKKFIGSITDIHQTQPASGDHAIENVDMSDDSSATEPMSICEERWRNAGPEAHKKMFALFAVSGVFVCLCRHGHMLVMCDMIRSGKL